MSGIIIVAVIILAYIVIYQIGTALDISTELSEDQDASKEKRNKIMAWAMLIVFLIGTWAIYYCDVYSRDKMLPVSASEQGVGIDFMSNYTLWLLAIVFFITHILLFGFIFFFRWKKNRKPLYYPHNNKLEILWTTLPAMVLLLLIITGLKDWYKITGKAPANAMVVEIVGKQFNWVIHYPGADGVLGQRDFRLINEADNILGLDWNDPASHDDIIIENGEMHVIKGKPVNLVINSRDVIHSVGLPHFRMKMDAVPGITTNLWFTPTITSEEMIKKTKNPNFVYEIACDQMCGKGHYSMRGTVIVNTKKEFKSWIAGKQPYYSMHHDTNAGAENQGVAVSNLEE